MVDWETLKRVTPNLYNAGKEFVLKSIHNEPKASGSGEGQVAASTEYLVQNWLEALFASFQMVVLWHDPFISLCAISGLLSSFLLLSYFAPRLYATIMIGIFIYNLTKVWFRHVWPEIRVPPEEGSDEAARLDVDRWTHLHPQLMTLNELGQVISNLMKASEHYLQKLLELRRERPVTFCLAICSTLSCTAYIGDKISGQTMVLVVATTIVLAPGIYLYLLPKAVNEYLKQKINPGLRQVAQQTPCDPEPKESSSGSSPIATSLSLFEHLRRKSLSVTQELLVPERSSEKEVPINEDRSAEATMGDKRKPEAQINATHDTQSGLGDQQSIPRRGSDDFSSNGSASLIDFEEDQQDGFVIL